MVMHVEVRQLEPQPAVGLKYRVPMSQMGPSMAQAFGRVMAFLGSRGAQPAGMPFSAYPKTQPDDEGCWEVVTGFPVSGKVGQEGDFVEYDLPGGKVAVATHMGSYDTLSQTYAVLKDWACEHEMAPAGTMWECYLTDPSLEPDQSRWRTDVYMPVKPVA